MKDKVKLIKNDIYLLLIDEEAEISQGDIIVRISNNEISEANDEWSGEKDNDWKKIISYHYLTKEAKELDLPLLPNPFEEVDIEQLAKDIILKDSIIPTSNIHGQIVGFQLGYQTAQSSNKQFSLEDMISLTDYILKNYRQQHTDLFRKLHERDEKGFIYKTKEEVVNEFIQSLSTQQLPKEFIPKYEYIDDRCSDCGEECFKCQIRTLKTITNSDGKLEIQGRYVY